MNKTSVELEAITGRPHKTFEYWARTGVIPGRYSRNTGWIIDEDAALAKHSEAVRRRRPSAPAAAEAIADAIPSAVQVPQRVEPARPDDLITLEQAAKRAHRSVSTVRRWVSNEEIRSWREDASDPNSRIFVRSSEIDMFLEHTDRSEENPCNPRRRSSAQRLLEALREVPVRQLGLGIDPVILGAWLADGCPTT
jgi:hypothetical protein